MLSNLFIKISKSSSHAATRMMSSAAPAAATASTLPLAEDKARFIEAVKSFRLYNGHALVPDDFVVPVQARWSKDLHGLKLGELSAQAREQKDSFSEEQLNELDAELFAWTDDEYKFVLQPIIENYHAVHKKLRISKKYKIPNNKNWPRGLHGFNLGERLQAIRSGEHELQPSQYDHLTALGFHWNPNVWHWRNKSKPALKKFVEIYGHPNVPSRFIVPHKEPWPEAFHGLKLGIACFEAKRGNLYNVVTDEDKAELEALGYIFKKNPVLRRNIRKVKA